MTFNQIYNEHYELIYRFVFRTGGPEFAKDITQDTFIKLYKFLESGGKLENPKSWLYKVSSNLCINFLNRKTRYWGIMKDISEMQKDVFSENDYLKKEKIEQFNLALSKLSTRDRIILQLYNDGLSYVEIAEAISVKTTSIGKILSRAIEKAANIIKKETGYEMSG